MRLLATFTLLIICLHAIGQTFSDKKALTLYPGTYIDTEARYTDSAGINVIIQNSVPKWGTPLLDSARREQGFSSLIFFNRIINETNDPIELTIDFPPDSFPSPGSPDAYLKIFLPRDTMTVGNEAAYSHGLTSLESLFDDGSAKPTTFHRTIYPRQDCLFYVVLLFNERKALQGQGFYNTGTRARFTLEAQNLFYKINQLNFTPIPCGQIVLKKH
jgi:hypothetical protein